MSDASLSKVKQLFTERFGYAPTHAASAPGRVNIIGEHVDYCDGFVFPMALEHRTYVVAKPNGTDKYRIYAPDLPEAEQYSEWTTSEADLAPAKGKFKPYFTNYIRGVIAQFPQREGFDAAVISNVPIGGGLSSSAALEVAFYFLLMEMYNEKRDLVRVSKDCQKAENEWSGVPCGIMDQTISAMGKQGNLLLLDCMSMGTRHVSIPDPNLTVLITNSNVKHALEGGEYAERRASTVAVMEAIKKLHPEVKTYRDVTMEHLDAAKQQGLIDDLTYRRGRHVIGEIARTTKFADLLQSKDGLAEAGKLMVASHQSLSEDFGVSTPELDQLVKIVTDYECKNMFPGAIGSRMTGGGFGGCTVTLIHKDHVDDLIKKIHAEYTLGKATCFASAPGEGARVEKL